MERKVQKLSAKTTTNFPGTEAISSPKAKDDEFGGPRCSHVGGTS
jgi:hypothetical protein